MGVSVPEPLVHQSGDLAQFIEVLSKRRWTIIAITLLVLLSAMLLSFAQTPIYRSTAKVLVKPLFTPLLLLQPPEFLVDLETEREIVRSQEVAERAAEAFRSRPSPDDLLERLSVSVPADTLVLVIEFSDPGRVRAREGTQAFADGYIDYKTGQQNAAIDELRRPIQRQIEDVHRELAELRRAIAGRKEGATAEQQSKHDILTGQLAVLGSQLAPLNGIVVDPGDIIQNADLPSAPASPNHAVNVALGLFVGLTLGVGVAFLRERLDDRLRGRLDLEGSSGAPVLGVIPKITGWRKKGGPRLITLEEPMSAASEAYRTLRTSVQFIARQRGMKAIMVASAHAGEGKTSTVANLGVVLAQVEKEVILVSADVRQPRLHDFFEVKNELGMVNLLAGEAKGSDALVRTNVERLRVLPSGPVPTLPAELLGSEAMGELIDELRRQADFLLIDTPAILEVSDALSLAPLTDAVIYVADPETTTRRAVMQARGQLEQMGANVFAAVLNGFDPSAAGDARYYRYYYRQAERNGPLGAAPGGARREEEPPQQGDRPV